MGEWRAEKSLMSYINGDHVDEAMGLRVIVMSVNHGQCAIGKLPVEDAPGNVADGGGRGILQHAAMEDTGCCGDGTGLGQF